MKKLFILFILPLFLLFSCGKKSVYGVYGFQMGKDNDSHIAFSMELMEEEVKTKDAGGNEKLLGKKFNLKLDLNDEMKPVEPDVDSDNYLEAFLVYVVMDMLTKPEGVDGYYSISDKKDDLGRQRIKFGIQIKDVFDPEDTGFDIPNELIEEIILAYLKDGKISLIIPVSVGDVLCQLTWYGLFIYIDIDNVERTRVVDLTDENDAKEYGFSLIDEKFPVIDGDRIGTHPTVDQVKGMNTEYKTVFSDTPVGEEDPKQFFTFRDWHVLNMELTKK